MMFVEVGVFLSERVDRKRRDERHFVCLISTLAIRCNSVAITTPLKGGDNTLCMFQKERLVTSRFDCLLSSVSPL